MHIVSRWSSGLPAIERERPSIVFTDLSMPGVNGLQLLDALRQRLGQGDVRVVRDRRRAPYSGNGCCGPAARPTSIQNCSVQRAARQVGPRGRQIGQLAFSAEERAE